LFTLPLSRTTTRGSILSEATKADSRISQLPGPSRISTGVGVSNPCTENTAHSENGDTPLDSQTPSHHCAKSIEKELNYCTLVQRSRKYGYLTPGESSIVCTVGSLRSLQIQIEHATGSNGLTYYLKWLGTEEAAEVRKKGSLTHMIDTEHLEDVVTLHGQNSLYLIAKDTVLKVAWASRDRSLSY
jgi:hypothetical protein